MVNFYNDYLTCSKEASLTDVAGKRLYSGDLARAERARRSTMDKKNGNL